MSGATYRPMCVKCSAVMLHAFTTPHDLTIMQSHTIADALVSWALSPTSTDARIRQVIDALEAIDYHDTAASLRRLNAGSRSPVVEAIDAYSTKA